MLNESNDTDMQMKFPAFHATYFQFTQTYFIHTHIYMEVETF